MCFGLSRQRLLIALLQTQISLAWTCGQTSQALADRPDGVGVWGIRGGENWDGPEWPWYKGAMVTSSWPKLEKSLGLWDEGKDTLYVDLDDIFHPVEITPTQGDRLGHWKQQVVSEPRN